jgi:hypothetical protein
MSNSLLAQLRKRREKWVDLGEGRRIKFLRPAESDQGMMLKVEGNKATWAVGIDQVREFVVDWDGFTEANILGPEIGGDMTVAFDRELFEEMVKDDVSWVGKVAQAILDSVVEHINSKDATAKNSEAGSTSAPASSSTESSPKTTSTTA